MEIKKAKVMSVIFIQYIKGDGTESNPTRIVNQYRDLKGNLICELDDYEKDNKKSEVKFSPIEIDPDSLIVHTTVNWDDVISENDIRELSEKLIRYIKEKD